MNRIVEKRTLMIALAIASAGGTGACVDVADGRAARDAKIGTAAADGVLVAVEGGLASVRTVEPGRLALWAQAPALSFRLTLETPRAGTFDVEIDNALHDAVLTGTGPDGAALTIDTLPGPTPTRLRFRVQVAAGTSQFALATPDAAIPGPLRFAIFADVQSAIGRVGDIFARLNADPQLRFCLISGDLTEQGTRGQLGRFQREMEALGIPAFATVGNHELGEDPPPFQDLFGRGSFHFDFAGHHFTLLDAASATIAPRVYDWLDGWLAHGAGGLHTVVMHIPPVDPAGTRNGSFASRGEAGKLLGLLARGGVDLTVYGHVHSYWAFDNAGIPAYISGGGGAIPERFDGIHRHYLAVDLDPARQSVEVALVRVD